MNRILEHALLAIAGLGLAYFIRWTWHDIKRENRPPVTDEMLDQAYIDMLEQSEFYVLDEDENP